MVPFEVIVVRTVESIKVLYWGMVLVVVVVAMVIGMVVLTWENCCMA